MHIALKMVNECYFSYMTLFLFYLVYRFGKNRDLGTIAYKESLVESAVEDGAQGKQQMSKKYWKWLMNTKVYEGVDYGTLDQAVLQEYIDIDGLLQKHIDKTRYDFGDIEQQPHSRSLVERAEEFEFFDKDNVLLNKTGKREKTNSTCISSNYSANT